MRRIKAIFCANYPDAINFHEHLQLDRMVLTARSRGFTFLQCRHRSCGTQKSVFAKSGFPSINERRRLIIHKMLDGFEGKLTSSKYAKIAKTSADTALRDIKDLIQKRVLLQTDAGGSNTSYELKW